MGKGFPTASVWQVCLWIASFITFTFLQLKYNKTPCFGGLLSVSDVIEFAVPVVVVPLYWMIFLSCVSTNAVRLSFWSVLPMVLSTVLFVHGHGVHLAANSLNNLCHASNGLKSACEGSLQILHYVQALDMFDEFVSHWLWMTGICGFCSSIIGVQIFLFSRAQLLYGSAVQRPFLSLVKRGILFLCACVYGVIFWAHNIEGSTVPLGLPFSLLLSFLLLFPQNRLTRTSPVAFLFCCSHIITSILLLSWYAAWGGFPEFSHLPPNFIGSFYATSTIGVKTEL